MPKPASRITRGLRILCAFGLIDVALTVGVLIAVMTR